MKPLTQTVLGNGKDGKEPGNCFSTSIASVLELEVEDVPNFAVGEKSWFMSACSWLMENYGMTLMSIPVREDGEKDWTAFFELNPNLYHLAGGPSSRAAGHSVVHKAGKMVHDPHPDRTGLEKVTSYDFFVLVDPSVVLRKEESK